MTNKTSATSAFRYETDGLSQDHHLVIVLMVRMAGELHARLMVGSGQGEVVDITLAEALVPEVLFDVVLTGIKTTVSTAFDFAALLVTPP
jgi:hypothetical protein